MTITFPGLIVLIVIAAICGALGKAIAGGVRGGLLVSIVLRFPQYRSKGATWARRSQLSSARLGLLILDQPST